MYGIDQNFGVFGVGVLVDAVAEVEYIAAAVAVVGKDASETSVRIDSGRTEGAETGQGALQKLVRRPGFANVAGPVKPNASAPISALLSSHKPAAFGKYDNRHAAAAFAFESARFDRYISG